MGWFVVNILVPLGVPMLFMLLSKLIPLPPSAVARTKLITLVQDGQLGWVALGFSASCFYDVYTYVTKVGQKAVTWADPVLGIAIVVIVASAFMAAVGALFPFDTALPVPTTTKEWIKRYANFLGTAIATVIAAALYTVVHYNLPTL